MGTLLAFLWVIYAALNLAKPARNQKIRQY